MSRDGESLEMLHWKTTKIPLTYSAKRKIPKRVLEKMKQGGFVSQ
jgi:hypothetical protein